MACQRYNGDHSAHVVAHGCMLREHTASLRRIRPLVEFGLKYVVQLQPYIVHMLHVGKGNILPRRQSTCTFEVHSI
jgi:hypothetical protein